jgi:hypothetical protein
MPFVIIKSENKKYSIIAKNVVRSNSEMRILADRRKCILLPI